MRGGLLLPIPTAVGAFIATNIDDLVILTLFFSQVNAAFRPQHVVVGQYIGFAAVVAASLPGFFGGLLVPRAWIGLLGLVPIAIGIARLVNPEKDEAEEIQAVSTGKAVPGAIASLLNPQIFNVAAVTFANGGDNIGIYVPLFASSDWLSLAVILTVFFLLVGVWCWLAYLLTRHPAFERLLTRYGGAFAPFILIALGIFILIESGSYRLLPWFR